MGSRQPRDYFELAHAPYASVAYPPTFTKLAALAKERRIFVRPGIWNGPGEPRGEFVSKNAVRFGYTTINIRARLGVHAMRDGFHSLLLAHEMGHHESWTNADAPDAYRALMEDPSDFYRRRVKVDVVLAHEIVKEEVRAWAYARTLLGELGITDFDRFDGVASMTVGTYVRELLP